MAQKINIDNVANHQFMSETSLERLIELVAIHIQQQNNQFEERFPNELRQTLAYYSNDPERARECVQYAISEYAYWNGGACQNLD